MALYLMNTKGKDDHRLISADTRHQAEQHFLGKHSIESKTITDPADGAELATKYPMEKAGDMQEVPEVDPKLSAGGDQKESAEAKDAAKA